MDIFVISIVNLPKFEVLIFVVILHKYFRIFSTAFDFLQYENKSGFHNTALRYEHTAYRNKNTIFRNAAGDKKATKKYRFFLYYNSIKTADASQTDSARCNAPYAQHGSGKSLSCKACLASFTALKNICPNCSTENSADDIFCAKCGTKLK